MSFEGKIVNSTGQNIPDGTYNMEFRIYTGCTNEPTSSTGCTAVWTEDYLNNNTQGVSFTSGTYQVNLGSICTFAGSTCESNTNTAINWNSYPLYMSLQIGNTSNCSVNNPGSSAFTADCGGDGAMNPYILLTSTPYAMNSAQLGGIAASGFVQTAPAATQTIQATANATGLIVEQNSGGAYGSDIFDVQGTGGSADDFLQVTSSAANTGNVLIQGIGSSSTVGIQAGTSGTISVGTANANTITVGNTGNNGTITLQANGISQVITGSGSAPSYVIKTSTNSASAFQIQNSSGTSFFSANSAISSITTGDINVGSASNESGAGRLFSDGFESGNFDQWNQGTSTSGTSTVNVVTSPVRDGKFGATIAMTGSGYAYVGAAIAGGTAVDARAYVYVTSQGSQIDIINLVDGADANEQDIYLDATGHLCWWNGAGAGTGHCSASVVSTGTWHEVELDATVNTSTGSGALYLDGNSVLSLTAQNTGSNSLYYLFIGESNAGRIATYTVDDVSADTVRPGNAAELNVGDSLHVDGTTSFGNSVLLQPAVNTSTAFQVDNNAGGNLFNVDTANYEVNVGTASSAANIALNVNGAIQQTGMSTPDTSGTYANDWTEIGECDITLAYGQYTGCDATISMEVVSDGDPSSFHQATIAAKVYQQNAMGGAPYITFQINGVLEYFKQSDFEMVTTTNTSSETSVKLFVKNEASYGHIYYTPIMNNNYPGWMWTPGTAYVASLPAGTQTAATYGDTVANTLAVSNNSLTTGNEVSIATTSALQTAGSLENISDTATLTTAAVSGSLVSGIRSLTANVTGTATPTLDNAATYGTNGLTSTFSNTYTVGSGHSNYYMLVGVFSDVGVIPTAVTYGGVSMTYVGVTGLGTGTSGFWIYALKQPTIGANKLVVTTGTSGTAEDTVVAEDYYNVNQTTPYGTFVTAHSGSGAPTITATSTSTGQVVTDMVASTGINANSMTSNQTTATYASNTGIEYGPAGMGASYKAAASGSTVMSWNNGTSWWGEVSFNLEGATATQSVTSALASLSDNCTVTSGGCTNGTNVLNLNEQSSGATGAVLQIQNSGTGDMVDMSNGSGTVARITSYGAATFQNSTNTTGAFQIQNSAASTIFNVDTTNGGAVTITNNGTTSAASIASVQEWDNNSGSGLSTLSVAPHTVGDLMVFVAQLNFDGNTITSISGGGVSNWQLVGSQASSDTVMYEGTITSTGTLPINLTYAFGQTVFTELVAQEFSSAYGTSTNWGVVNFGSISNTSSTTMTFASASSTQYGQAYWGYVEGTSTGSAGSTSGYSYSVTGNHDVLAYNTNLYALTTGSPTATQTSAGASGGISLVFSAAPASGNAFDVNGSSLVSASSTTALQVTNVRGTSILAVDTTNSAIVLGQDGTPSSITVRGGAASGANVAGSSLTFQASNGTGTAGSGSFLFQTGAASGASIGLDNTSSIGTSTTGMTLSYTTGSQANRLLVVEANMSLGNTVSTLTYNGVALTKLTTVGTTTSNGGGAHEEVWYLVAPASGTHNLVETQSGSNGSLMPMTFYNVNQTTPLGTAVTATGTASTYGTASVSVTGTSVGQLVLDAVTVDEGCAPPVYLGNAASGQTQIQTFNSCNPYLYSSGASSKPGTGGTVAMSWPIYNSDWGEIAVPINLYTAGAGTTSDTFSNTLSVGNNGVVIQDANGNNLMSTNSTSDQVIIGSGATGEASPKLIVLDNGTSTSDPSGVNGAIYYQTGGVGGPAGTGTGEGVFRCYQGGTWQDCIGTPQVSQRRWGYAAPAGNTSTTLSIFGQMGALTQNGGAADTAKADGMYVSYTTGTTNGNAAGVTASVASTEANWLPRMFARIRTGSAINSQRIWVDLASGTMTAADNTSTGNNFVGLVYDTNNGGTGANWYCDAGNGSADNPVSTGVAVTTSTYYDIELDLSTFGTLVCSVSVNGGAFKTVTNSTDLPTGSTGLFPESSVTTLQGSAANFETQYLYDDQQ